MARLVESVVKEFESSVQYRKVVTRTYDGARRYQALVRQSSRLLPVPSIVVNGSLAFDSIPDRDRLREFLNRLVHHKPRKDVDS